MRIKRTRQEGIHGVDPAVENAISEVQRRKAITTKRQATLEEIASDPSHSGYLPPRLGRLAGRETIGLDPDTNEYDIVQPQLLLEVQNPQIEQQTQAEDSKVLIGHNQE